MLYPVDPQPYGSGFSGYVKCEFLRLLFSEGVEGRVDLPFDQPGRARSRSFGSRLNCLLRPNAGATYSDASLRMTGFSLSAGVVVVPAGTAGPFDSRLNCWLRPKAGATYLEASLRMTGFSLSTGVVVAPAGTAGPFDSRLNCLLRPNAGATYSDASLRMTGFSLSSGVVAAPAKAGPSAPLRSGRDDNSFGMTGFLLSSGVVAAPAGTAGPSTRV